MKILVLEGLEDKVHSEVGALSQKRRAKQQLTYKGGALVQLPPFNLDIVSLSIILGFKRLFVSIM